MTPSNREKAEHLLERLMEKMWFRGPLPDEGFAVDTIEQVLLEARNGALEEAARYLLDHEFKNVHKAVKGIRSLKDKPEK